MAVLQSLDSNSVLEGHGSSPFETVLRAFACVRPIRIQMPFAIHSTCPFDTVPFIYRTDTIVVRRF